MSCALHHFSADRFPDMARQIETAGASVTAALRACGIADYQRLSTRLSARSATMAEAQWLAIPPGAPVLFSAAIDGLPDGTPIHLVDTVFAGERVEMIVEPE